MRKVDFLCRIVNCFLTLCQIILPGTIISSAVERDLVHLSFTTTDRKKQPRIQREAFHWTVLFGALDQQIVPKHTSTAVHHYHKLHRTRLFFKWGFLLLNRIPMEKNDYKNASGIIWSSHAHETKTTHRDFDCMKVRRRLSARIGSQPDI